jgi:hypothetical protein
VAEEAAELAEVIAPVFTAATTGTPVALPCTGCWPR